MAAPAVAHKISKGTAVDLKSLGIDEAYLENFIDADPSVLGLGDDLSVVERQRRQGNAGRLDLLLQDDAGEHRYEVELMLGGVDESHVIRTIEYWDIERRRYPAYEHCAVLVAEDVTARFLNVITLFSGSIPIIAIQVNAIKVDDKAAITFIRLVDSRNLREDPPLQPRDRAYWEERVGSGILQLVDGCLALINDTASRKRALNYNKQFIGLTDDGRPDNFVDFSPKKAFLWLNLTLDPAEPWRKRAEDAGLECKRADYGLRVRLTAKDFVEHKDVICQMLREAVSEDEKE